MMEHSTVTFLNIFPALVHRKKDYLFVSSEFYERLT